MPLSRYVEQLLKDIRDAKKNVPEEPVQSYSDDLEDHFEEIERYVNPQPGDQRTIAEWTGLDPASFPPVDKLTTEEQAAINNELVLTFRAFNWAFEVPDEAPEDFCYELLIKELAHEIMMTHYGHVTIDYCTGSPEDCELKQYCPCLKFDAEKEMREFHSMEDFDQARRELDPPGATGKVDTNLQRQIRVRFASKADRDFILQLLENYPGIDALRIEGLFQLDWEEDDLPF